MAGRLCSGAWRVNGRDEVADHNADQDREQSRKAAKVDCRADRGEQCDRRGKRLTCVVSGRGARERQADHCHHRARDHGRQQVANRVDADEVHDEADDQVDHAGHHDARISEAVIVGRALNGQHRADEGEARSEVAGHLEPGDDQEDQGRHATEEDHGVRVEAEDQRHQDGGAEHGHHVLETHEDRLRPRETVLRINDVALPRGGGYGHDATPSMQTRPMTQLWGPVPALW